MTQDMANYDTGTALVPAAHSALVMPVATADEVRAAVRAYEAMKSAILQKRDVVRISGQDAIKKSGWLRIALAFGVSAQVVKTELMTATGTQGDDWGYLVIVQATAPNGAFMTGDGMCWASEKVVSQRTRHNVHAHAATRAMNRAISNLVGGGEVSAEELTNYVDADPDPAPIRALPANRPAVTSAPPAPAKANLANLVSTLQRRCAAVGMSLDDRETMCVEVLGKARINTLEDYHKVAERVAQIERDHKANHAAAARVPDDALEGVETGTPA